MSTITGRMTDAGLTPFQGRWPTLRFRPDAPAATATGALVMREPVSATITDATGVFTVTVVSTDELLPPVLYTITAQWDAGQELNVLEHVRVPTGDVTFFDLLIASSSEPPGRVHYGYGPPPSELTGVLYFDISGLRPVLYAPSEGGV